MTSYQKMENLKTQIQNQVTKEKIVLRAMKKLFRTHFTTRDVGRECGCSYCCAMILYIDAKIHYRKMLQYYDATWGYYPKEKVISELEKIKEKMLLTRENAKRLRDN